MTLVAELVADTRCVVGESPLWDPRGARLCWIDIDASALLRLEHDGSVRTWPLPEKPGCLAHHAHGGFIAAMQSTVRWLVPHDDGRVDTHVLASVTHPASPMRFNDGRCDRQGRLWTGAMHADTQSGQRVGALYRYTGAGLQRSAFDGICVTNGLAFAPDGRTMYFADTFRDVRLVWACDYDPATGTPGARRVFVDLHRHVGRPDGAAVDADGCYWVCATDAGCVLRFSPQGERIGRVDLPVKKPGMVAFGGAQLDTLYITSLRPRNVDLTDQPLAGGLFAVRPGVSGIAETPFDPAVI